MPPGRIAGLNQEDFFRKWLIDREQVFKSNSLPDLWFKFGGGFRHRIWNRFIDWRNNFNWEQVPETDFTFIILIVLIVLPGSSIWPFAGFMAIFCIETSNWFRCWIWVSAPIVRSSFVSGSWNLDVLIDFSPVPCVFTGTVSGFRAEKKYSTVQYSFKKLHKGKLCFAIEWKFRTQ